MLLLAMFNPIYAQLLETRGAATEEENYVQMVQLSAVQPNNVNSLINNLQEMSRAQKRRTVKGALIGVAAGGLTGVVLGAALYKEREDCGLFVPCSRGEVFVNNALLGGVLGGITGLIIGNLTYEEKWKPPFRVTGSKFTMEMGSSFYTPRLSIRFSLSR